MWKRACVCFRRAAPPRAPPGPTDPGTCGSAQDRDLHRVGVDLSPVRLDGPDDVADDRDDIDDRPHGQRDDDADAESHDHQDPGRDVDNPHQEIMPLQDRMAG